MRILFYIESLRAGGKERRLVELIKGLKKYPDVKMELVLTKYDIHYTDIFETGIKIHYTIRKGLKKDPRVFWKFYKITKNFKPDVINVWGSMVAFYAIPAKVLLGVAMVNNQITNAPQKIKGGILSHKVTFIFSDKIIANSIAGIKAYNVPKEKSSVIYNGFDFNRVNNLDNKELVRKKINVITKYVVGMVASFTDFKDYNTYISVALKILKERNDISFLCIGAGNDNQYRKMVPKEYISRILFLGKQENIESIMNICDIGVLTSNTKIHGEGISNALMEFSALAKPIIATNNGGTPEIIEDGVNGFLIKPFDENELKDRILKLLSNEKIRINFGITARKIIEKKFNIDRMTNEFYKEFKRILK